MISQGGGGLLAGTALRQDEVVPGTRMVDAATGRSMSAWDFRGRRALVLCFLHAGCEPCQRFLAGLASLGEEVRFADGELRAVLPAAQAPGGYQAPVLLDVSGEVTRRFLGARPKLPVVVVLDRYAAAQAAYPAAAHRFPAPEEVVGTLRHLAIMCPECGN